MLSDHWEPFDLMTEARTTDAAGSVRETLTPQAQVFALAVYISGGLVPAGPGEAAASAVDLIHEPGYYLAPGTLLRRQRDGAMFRVTGDDSLRRTPPWA